jgi:hypothetical protein
MKCLDLVVCVDTSVNHLAGALGVPTWLALSAVSDWRWLRGREDSVWYGGHRLFRQERPGDWDRVFARMAAELARLAARKGGQGVLNVEVPAGQWLDRLSIAQIKAERIADTAKQPDVRAELAALQRAGAGLLPLSAEVQELAAQLKGVNERLWDVEDQLRLCEKEGDFSERFVGLARSVYQLNDLRTGLKREINQRMVSCYLGRKCHSTMPVCTVEDHPVQ